MCLSSNSALPYRSVGQVALNMSFALKILSYLGIYSTVVTKEHVRAVRLL